MQNTNDFLNAENTENFKPTSSQAKRRKKKVHKLRAQASSLSQQAQGHKQPE